MLTEDRDFGAVLQLSLTASLGVPARRAVRVLPANADVLHDAVLELAAIEGMLPAPAKAIVTALAAAADGHEHKGSDVRVDFCIEAGELRRMAPHSADASRQ